MTALMSATNNTNLINIWGYGGYAHDSSMNLVSEQARYWSSTENSSGSNYAYYLYYGSGSLLVTLNLKYNGFQVRCVKD
jgi:uncharacterized protein (TIGR02145 family)